MRGLLRRQEGGIAILMVLAFMFLGVPVVTSTLEMADSLAVKSRAQTGLLRRQYCGLGTTEYISYLALDSARWQAWLEDAEGADSVTIEGCEDTVLSTAQLAESPGDSADPSFQQLQISFKEVTPSQAAPGILTSFDYTITIRNQGSGSITLERVTDYLPPWFSYVGPTVGSITSIAPTIAPDEGAELCGDRPDQLTWDLDPAIALAPQQSATLTFTANGSLPEGTYHNKVTLRYRPLWNPDTVVDIHTPYTAEVAVGSGAAKCGFNMDLLVRKKLTNVRTLAPDPRHTEFTYSISVENVTSSDIPVQRMVDLLPPGFRYVAGSSEGITSDDPTSDPEPCLQPPDTEDLQRCELTWGGGDQDLPLFTIGPGVELFQTLKTDTFSDPALAFYNEVRVVYHPQGFVSWSAPYADMALSLDNSLSISGSELVQLKDAANEIVDGFTLWETGDRIRIGMARFSTTTEATVGMTDVDIHRDFGFPPGTYYLNDSAGNASSWYYLNADTWTPYPLGASQGNDSEQDSHTPAEDTWEEIPEYWETPAYATDGVIPAATWTHRQRFNAEDNENDWRWKVEVIRNDATVQSFTSNSEGAPTWWSYDENDYNPGQITIQAGDKLRLHLEVFSSDNDSWDRETHYRWGGDDYYRSRTLIPDLLPEAPGDSLPWSMVQGSESVEGEHTPARGANYLNDAEWEEVSDYWETAPATAAGVLPQAIWTHRQRLWAEREEDKWRWKVQLVRGAQITDLFTSSSDDVPNNWNYEEIAYSHGALTVEEGDKLRFRLEVWSDATQEAHRLFKYRWGGDNYYRPYTDISLAVPDTPLHDGINGMVVGFSSGVGISTNIVGAIDAGAAQFATGLGDRAEAPNVIVVITDGDDTTGNSTADIIAASAASGAEIFAVGVGAQNDVDPETLFAISYDPDDPGAVFDSGDPDPYYSDHVFHADNFTALLDLVNDIVDAVLLAAQTVVTAEGGNSTGGTLYNMTAIAADGTVVTYRVIVTSDGEVQILDWPT